MTGKFVPASHTIMPIQIRAGVIVYLQGIPHDLTFAEAEKLVAVIRGLAMLSAAPSPDVDEVERAAEQPAWGVWVDYNRAPPGSYACLVSRLINGEWGEPEAKWMPAQGRPPLPGKIRIMPHLMPGDPLALSALPRR